MTKIFPLLFFGITEIGVLYGQPSEEVTKVGFCFANYIDVRWYKDQHFFEQKVNELGGKTLVRDAINDPENKLSQAKELIDSGVKVLVVIPVDANKSGELVNVAHQEGIKVIAYDRLIMNSDLDYYVSFDSYKVGENMAFYVTHLKSKGNYILINGPVSDNNSILVKDGAMSVLTPYIQRGDIDLICNTDLSEWIELDAYFAVTECLQNTDKTIDAIITGADILARGVIMALDEQNLTDKILLTGQNADLESVRDIVAGKQTMTVYKSLQKLAENAAVIAMRIAIDEKSLKLEGTVFNGKREVPSLLFNPVVVDINNIDETLVKTGHLSAEEIYDK